MPIILVKVEIDRRKQPRGPLDISIKLISPNGKTWRIDGMHEDLTDH
jgi:hypothetical protein